MVAWYWLIVVFLLTNALTSFTYEWFDWENVWTNIIAFFALVILYIPMAIYVIFFKNTIHPIPEARWNEITNDAKFMDDSKFYHLFGTFYLWIDPDASRLYKKAFFAKVKKLSIDK